MKGISTSNKLSKGQVVKGLKDPDERVRCSTLGEVMRAGESDAVYMDYAVDVAKMLNDQSTYVQQAALQVLGEMPLTGAQFGPQVAEKLKSSYVDIQCQAALCIGKFGKNVSDSVADALGAQLDHENEGVRMAVVESLGLVKRSKFAEGVKGKLNDKISGIRGAALVALGRFGMEAAAYADAVAEKLNDPMVRGHAVAALVEFGEAGASHAEKVLPLLQDQDAVIREAATQAMGLFGASAVHLKGKIASELSNKDGRFRAAAAVALASMKQEADDFADQVAKLLDDDFEDASPLILSMAGVRPRSPAYMRKTQCAAAYCLGQMGAKGEAFADKVAKLLNHEDWERRYVCMEALGNMKEPGAKFVKEVCSNFKHKDHTIRAMACATCGKFTEVGYGIHAGSMLADLFSDEAPTVRYAAVMAMGKLPLDRSAEHANAMAKLLMDRVFTVRAAAMVNLGKLGPKGQVYAADVAKGLEDPDCNVRAECCWALVEMGDRGAAFAEEMATLLADENLHVRCVAAECLGALGEEGAEQISGLVRLLQDPVNMVRVAALKGLEKLGSLAMPALATVEAMGKESNDEIRSAVQKAVSAIKGGA